MGDEDSYLVIYPFRVNRVGDIPIIIPSQEGYDKCNFKNILKYYHYSFFSPRENTKFSIPSQYVFGRSAEDLAGKLELFLKKNKFSGEQNLDLILSPPTKTINVSERNGEVTYECCQFNDEEKLWFSDGLKNFNNNLLNGKSIFLID